MRTTDTERLKVPESLVATHKLRVLRCFKRLIVEDDSGWHIASRPRPVNAMLITADDGAR